MDIGKAFGFITEDEAWLNKLGLGALFGAIPFVNFAIFGYQVQIARNVARGEERPLPDWSDFGGLFVDGLRFVGVMFVYALPVILVYACALIAVFGVALASEEASRNGASPPDPAFIIPIIFTVVACVIPYSILLWVVWPAVGIQLARTSRFAACFDFKAMWAIIKARVGDYVIIIGIMIGLNMALSLVLLPVYFVVGLIPCIGFIITLGLSGVVYILVYTVLGHLEGQYLRHLDADLAAEGMTPETAV